MNSNWTRRELLRFAAQASACITLGNLPAAGQDTPPRLRSYPFPFGVASGDPRADGVVLWTRLDINTEEAPARVGVRWEVADDEQFTKIARRGTHHALPALGYSVHVEVDGLRPGRKYWYRFLLDDATVSGRTQTAPAVGAPVDRVKFAFASCQNYEQGYFTAFSHMSSEDLDFVVHLGDYIYERRFGQPQMIVRDNEFPGEVKTLDQYRARYANYRRDPNLQSAHAAFPWIVTTDDHEVSNNYAGVHSEDGTSVEEFARRRAAGYQAYYEFMPLRRSSMPRGPDMRLFRRVSYGDLATLHVLDTRQYRSDQACGDGTKPRCEDAMSPSRTILGKEQEKWLMDGMRSSRARWNILANQVMIAQLQQTRDAQRMFSMDKWDGYVESRQRLMHFLHEAKPSNPVVLTGDIHSHWAADLKLDFSDPKSPTVAAELVGTSITSGGDGAEVGGMNPSPDNPHIHFYANRRGYVRVALGPKRLTADFRITPFVSKPGAPISDRASFVVEDGRPGLQLAKG